MKYNSNLTHLFHYSDLLNKEVGTSTITYYYTISTKFFVLQYNFIPRLILFIFLKLKVWVLDRYNSIETALINNNYHSDNNYILPTAIYAILA